jgi:hypothetical protein
MTGRRWCALLLAGGAIALLVVGRVTPVAPSPAGARWGVDQLHIHRTGAGHLLDLRYRVVDPQRAGSLLGKQSAAYVVHARSGRRLSVPSTPKAGALRNTGVPKAGRTYFALFSDPGEIVRAGDRVSVVLGDLTAELTVE